MDIFESGNLEGGVWIMQTDFSGKYSTEMGEGRDFVLKRVSIFFNIINALPSLYYRENTVMIRADFRQGMESVFLVLDELSAST